MGSAQIFLFALSQEQGFTAGWILTLTFWRRSQFLTHGEARVMGGKWVTGRAGETRVVNVGVGLVGDDLAFIYKFNFLLFIDF